MNNTPSHIIVRNHYLNKVKPFVNQSIIKVFTGQRRVGKSYLLFQLMDYIKTIHPEPSILYINKEDLVFSFLITAEDLVSYVNEKASKTSTTYIFIDEIQDIFNFSLALRSLLLNEKLDIYCTGSNANMLSSDISGHLSGRFVEINVQSLSYLEFLDFHNLKDSAKVMELYIKYGGLPYLKNLPLQDDVVFEYLKNIYNTIVYRDVINRYAIRNVHFLEKLVHFMCSNTGSLFSNKKISDFLKSQKINIPPSQVQLYVNYLANAFLIHKVGRYDLIGKRLFEVGDKYYFENLGIRNALWGYRLEDRGKIIENVVYNELLYKGYQVQVGIMGTQEIDFIAQKNTEKWYIQVALNLNEEKTLVREFGNLLKIQDNYRKTVVTLDTYQGASYEGIEVVNLRSFCLLGVSSD
jgi:predicted AAA+ superfamily ATPase